MNTDTKTYYMIVHSENGHRATERSEACEEGGPPYTNMNTNMKTYYVKIHNEKGADRTVRSEAREASLLTQT